MWKLVVQPFVKVCYRKVTSEDSGMAKLVTGIFKTRSSAMLAIEDLMRHGIPQEDISVQMTDTNSGREFYTDVSSKAPEGGVMGTLFGALVGAGLAALTALHYIPDYSGIGSHGLLIATLAGLGVGALIGLVIGMIAGSSLPEYETDLFQTDKRHGAGILEGVYCHERREHEVRRLMEAAGGSMLRSKSLRTEPLRVHTTREYAGVAPSDDADRLPPSDRLPPADRPL
jgi:hypothetical protein